MEKPLEAELTTSKLNLRTASKLESNPGHFGGKLVLGSLRFDGGNVNDDATKQ